MEVVKYDTFNIMNSGGKEGENFGFSDEFLCFNTKVVSELQVVVNHSFQSPDGYDSVHVNKMLLPRRLMCLFVSAIEQKLLNEFPWILGKGFVT